MIQFLILNNISLVIVQWIQILSHRLYSGDCPDQVPHTKRVYEIQAEEGVYNQPPEPPEFEEVIYSDSELIMN